MRAVSNTSPVSNLACIGRLDLLKHQYQKLWIPASVSEELSLHPDESARTAIESAIGEGWIEVVLVPSSPLLKTLMLHLHRGEAEAIALATETKADIVLIDEQEGRQFATQAGLSVTGVLGVLLRAKKTGHIAALRPVIDALRANARFFIAPALEARVLSEAGE